MKKNIIKLFYLALIVVALGSCVAKKKYGCPNHISIFSVIAR